jgi:hypothetical protein
VSENACTSCSRTLEPDELFCAECHTPRDTVTRIGDVSTDEVLSSDLADGFRGAPGPTEARSYRGTNLSGDLGSFKRGFLFVLENGLAFFAKQRSYALAQGALARTASAFVPFGGLAVWGAARAARGSKEKQFSKILADPSTYVIPFSEICELAVNRVQRSGFLKTSLFFLTVMRTAVGRTFEYTIYPEWLGKKSGYLIGAALAARSKGLVRLAYFRRLAEYVDIDRLRSELANVPEDQHGPWFASRIENELETKGLSEEILKGQVMKDFGPFVTKQMASFVQLMDAKGAG